MGSVNRVILVGNLGRDAELRYTPGGAAVAKFSLATTEVWNDKGGQRQERTEWHNIDLWGKQAESLSEYLVKGKRVTGFTNAEEEAVGLTAVVPFLLEDRLKERGGIFGKTANWAPYVQVDGKLVTGQNPASSGPGAEELLKLLGAV